MANNGNDQASMKKVGKCLRKRRNTGICYSKIEPSEYSRWGETDWWGARSDTLQILLETSHQLIRIEKKPPVKDVILAID